MLEDHVNSDSYVRLISPLTGSDNTAFVSQIIDLQMKDGCTFAIATGTLADADATFATKIEESNASDMSGAVDVSADATKTIGTVPQFDFSKDDKVFAFGYRGACRYVRVTVTPSANAGSAPIGGVCILHNKKIGTGPTGS